MRNQVYSTADDLVEGDLIQSIPGPHPLWFREPTKVTGIARLLDGVRVFLEQPDGIMIEYIVHDSMLDMPWRLWTE